MQIVVNAQIIADFSMDNPEGCPPLIVQFTDLTTGGADTIEYSWDFKNGNGSNEQNPVATFTSPGTYQVTLTIVNGPSVSKNITVFKQPVAGFTTPDRKGCQPFQASFTDTSKPGDGAITQWNWDFRDGATSNDQNTTHPYTKAGTYDVFLEVTDENNCKGNILKENYIDVADWPMADFAAVPNVACEVPVEIAFNNNSTGSGNLTYNWDFDNGNGSTDENTAFNFTQFGVYDIQLIVNSDYGCADTLKKPLNINNINATATIFKGTTQLFGGETICPGQLTFNSTVPGTEVFWDFGDNKSSAEDTISHNYNFGGNYTVQMIAAPGTPCADTQSWTFTVYDVSADFEMSEVFTCKSPVEITFTDASEDASSWEWNFGDGKTSSAQNPTHTFSVPKEEDVYALNTEYNFNISLTITNSNGCEASSQNILKIRKPTARFEVDTAQGCAPLTVKFDDYSLSNESIINFEWLFDDGNNKITTTDTVSHTFDQPGEYQSKVVITNNKSCTDTSFPVIIRVGEQIAPVFAVSKTNVCPNETIQLTDVSVLADSIDYRIFSIGGLPVSPSLSNKVFNWPVDCDTGTHNISMQTNFNGCLSETTKTNALNNIGAIADFNYETNCENPFNYQFINKSRKAESYQWNIDGITTTTSDTSITFGTEKDISAALIAQRGACRDTMYQNIYIRNSKLANILADTIACANTPIKFSSKNTFNTAPYYCNEGLLWDFGENTQPLLTKNDSVFTTFTRGGTYQVRLIARYDNFCTDTAIHSIHINAPNAQYTTDTALGCTPFKVVFTDISTPDLYEIEQYEWDFNDGSDTSYSSISGSFTHIFNTNNIFNVNLTVTDTAGCKGIFQKEIKTANPSANFDFTPKAACTGDSIAFSFDTINNPADSIQWAFGDGDFNYTHISLKHAYKTTGDIRPTLTVYRFGCPDTTIADSGALTLQQANAEFLVSDTTASCYPKLIEFTHLHTNDIDSLNSYWDYDIGQGAQTYLSKPKFNYIFPGVYHPKLLARTTLGCTDSSTQRITITGPTGTFNISGKEACRNQKLTFNVKEIIDATGFLWDMGDGVTFSDSTIEYAYTKSGYTYPRLILFGDSANCRPYIEDTVYIYNVMAGFTTMDSALCGGYNIPFTNNSTEFTSSKWNFDNGNTSQQTNPVANFEPGNYTVQLIVYNDTAGCTDTASQNILINNLPYITISNDTVLCEEGSAELLVSGGHSARWSTDNNELISGNYSFTAAPDSTASYIAVITDTSTFCQNSDSVMVVLQYRPKLQLTPQADTTIGIGEYITLSTDSTGDNTYQWAANTTIDCPNCASITVRPVNSDNFQVTVADTNGCFNEMANINIEVLENYKIRLPSAFTPGNNENNIIYVRGWGISELIEFSIYNRYGNQVYFGTDINQGWDGKYNGKLQATDTYVYLVKVKLLNGTEVTEKGTFNLFR